MCQLLHFTCSLQVYLVSRNDQGNKKFRAIKVVNLSEADEMIEVSHRICTPSFVNTVFSIFESNKAQNSATPILVVLHFVHMYKVYFFFEYKWCSGNFIGLLHIWSWSACFSV